MQSHPSWVCGLKLELGNKTEDMRRSHPSWVCGLKQDILYYIHSGKMSHPSWVCGLKLCKKDILVNLGVTPFVGVWIETPTLCLGCTAP